MRFCTPCCFPLNRERIGTPFAILLAVIWLCPRFQATTTRTQVASSRSFRQKFSALSRIYSSKRNQIKSVTGGKLTLSGSECRPNQRPGAIIRKSKSSITGLAWIPTMLVYNLQTRQQFLMWSEKQAIRTKNEQPTREKDTSIQKATRNTKTNQVPIQSWSSIVALEIIIIIMIFPWRETCFDVRIRTIVSQSLPIFFNVRVHHSSFSRRAPLPPPVQKSFRRASIPCNRIGMLSTVSSLPLLLHETCPTCDDSTPSVNKRKKWMNEWMRQRQHSHQKTRRRHSGPWHAKNKTNVPCSFANLEKSRSSGWPCLSFPYPKTCFLWCCILFYKEEWKDSAGNNGYRQKKRERERLCTIW